MAISWRHPRKTGGLALLVVLVLAGTGWGLSGLMASSAPKSTLPPELAPDRLKAQAGDPRKMWETVRAARQRADLTDVQRDELESIAREAMEERMQKRMDEYFAAPQEQRVALLDREIDEMQERMKERRDRDRSASSQPRDRRDFGRREGQRTQAERKRRSESRSPDQEARRMAYYDAMRKRMDQRGIKPPPFGPGGRGGPGRGGRF